MAQSPAQLLASLEKDIGHPASSPGSSGDTPNHPRSSQGTATRQGAGGQPALAG